VPVSKANDLLGASYQLYRHAENERYRSPHDRLFRTRGATQGRADRCTDHVFRFTPGDATNDAPAAQCDNAPGRDQELREAFANAKPGSGCDCASQLRDDDYPDVLACFIQHKQHTFPPRPSSNKLGIAGYLDEFANHRGSDNVHEPVPP